MASTAIYRRRSASRLKLGFSQHAVYLASSSVALASNGTTTVLLAPDKEMLNVPDTSTDTSSALSVRLLQHQIPQGGGQSGETRMVWRTLSFPGKYSRSSQPCPHLALEMRESSKFEWKRHPLLHCIFCLASDYATDIFHGLFE